MKKAISVLFYFAFLLVVVGNFYCTNTNKVDVKPPFLNHADSVKYVGKQVCKNCHPAIYESFLKTGMGQSFGAATRKKSVADFSTQTVVKDVTRNLSYFPHWINDSLFITEFRLKGTDTIYKRTERVDYIIGSGQHTNSHLTSINGFIYQLPLTWFAQKGKWDLPPGFENGRNVRFSRAIEFECMSCHNAMPELVQGSINKFSKIPDGIDCERCHGPGEIHVAQKLKGIFVDTARQIDYTIVNPKKLSWERQIDVCQRCHLQGNTVLKPGKKFSDFKPGMRLNEVMEVFLPKYEGGENDFIMASHAQRLQESKCFIQSNKKVRKEEGKSFSTLNLTCITCHNPHVSVRQTGSQTFNNACINCHQDDGCSEEKSALTLAQNNCVSCHMPKSGSIDIPHVNVHDHKIRIPIKNEDLNAIKKFAGIFCVNSNNPSPLSRASAYLGYFEKFEGEKESLDSAQFWIQQLGDISNTQSLAIHAAYLRNDWPEIIQLSNSINWSKEKEPWLCYRVGQAFQNTGNLVQAQTYYLQAINLASDNLEFQNKLATLYVEQQQFDKAIQSFRSLLAKQPKQPDAWVNLGFAYVNKQQNKEAMQCYHSALKLDPDHNQALLNRAALFHLMGNNNSAIIDLERILELDPNQTQVYNLLNTIRKK